MARRPQKRRRLSSASTATSATDSSCTTFCTPSPALASDAFGSAFPFIVRDEVDLSCVSCHRALSSNSGKQDHLVICPRCLSTSCSICSRKCTSVPPSLPPTPVLSFSPSPPGTPLGPAENRPLPQEVSETPRTRTQARRTETARRRKHSENDDDDERTVVDMHDQAVAQRKGVGMDDTLPGCGRAMCKNCCIENVQTGATTCYDCYGLPSPRTPDYQSTPISKYPSTNPSMTSLLA